MIIICNWNKIFIFNNNTIDAFYNNTIGAFHLYWIIFEYLNTSSCLAFTSGFHPSLLKDWVDTENGVVDCCFTTIGAVTIPWPWFSVTIHKTQILITLKKNY